MTIDRIEFLGFSILGPNYRNVGSYKPKEWPKGWSVTVDGPHVVFVGEGRKVEVPRNRCIVHYAAPAEPAAVVPIDSGLVLDAATIQAATTAPAHVVVTKGKRA